MDWQHFPSQSAPEPGMHERRGYLDHPISQSVPGSYINTGYCAINGFATQSPARIIDLQPTRTHLNIQRGAGTHQQQHGHNLSLRHSNPSNSYIMSMYAQEQPLRLFANHQHQDTQTEPGREYSSPFPPPPPLGRDFDMEEMHDHDLTVDGLIPASPHQFTTGISEGTYSTYLHPSLVVPLPVPAPPIQFTATPEVSLPGSSLSVNSSRIHERYTNHRHVTTSGDLRTVESVLFAEDAPQPNIKPPAKLNHYVSVQKIPQIEDPSSPMRVTPYSSTADAGGDGQSGESGTPVPEEGIETLCMRSFPHNKKLREALQIIMNSRTAESQDLHQFLKTNEDSADRAWECLFEGDSGRCGRGFRRRDAAVGHIYLVHIKMLPVACEGVCGDPRCSRRFSSAATRSSHARKGSVKCNKCHSLTSGRNIRRHQDTKKCQRAAAAIDKLSR